MNIDAGHDFFILNFNLDGNAQNISTTKPFKRAYLQARGAETVYIRRTGTDAATKVLTLKDGNGVVFTVQMIPDSGSSIVLCDARTNGTGEVLEVLFTI